MLHAVFTYSLTHPNNIYKVHTILRNCGSKSDPSANKIDKTLAFFSPRNITLIKLHLLSQIASYRDNMENLVLILVFFTSKSLDQINKRAYEYLYL